MTTSVLVDSSIFLDVFQADPGSSHWSREALAQAGSTAALVINPIIWSDISARFQSEADLQHALIGLTIHKQPISFEAAFLAGKAHLAYRKSGDGRERTLPDFLVGAHAAVSGHALLTRDSARYRAYFPNLEIIAPETHP